MWLRVHALVGIVVFGVVAAHAVTVPTTVPIVEQMDIQNEEQVCVCPTDGNVMIAVWRDFRLGYRQVGIGRSTDGGLTWTDSLISPDVQIFNRQSDPTLTVDAAGNFYICILDYQAIINYDSAYVSWFVSTDKGLSWDGPHTVTDTIGPWFEDKEFTAVDRSGGPHDGNVYVAWNRWYNGVGNDPNKIQVMFARSTTGATSWDDTLVVGPRIVTTDCGWNNFGGGQFAYPLVGADGEVYVFWEESDPNPSTCEVGRQMAFAKSTDGGMTFSAPQQFQDVVGYLATTVDGSIEVYDAPIAAADISTGPYKGNVYVAFANPDTSNHANPPGDYNIEFMRTEDGGATWSGPDYINDDFIGNGAAYDQFHPWLVCDEQSGVLTAIWYDQRLDVANHYKFWLFAAHSFDGGETWGTNYQVSESPVDPDYISPPPPTPPSGPAADRSGPQRSGRLAEYIGLTSHQDRLTAVWTGTGEEYWFGVPFDTGQNVYSATWDLPLAEPRLISPEDAAGVTPVASMFQCNWASAWFPDSTIYIAEFARDPSFSSGPEVADTTSTIQATLNVADFTTGSIWYWRVRAVRTSVGDTSDYSVTWKFFLAGGCCSIRGDADGSGDLNVSDVTYLAAYLFSGGPEPPCADEGDVDASGDTNVSDLTYLIDYLFSGGPPPPGC